MEIKRFWEEYMRVQIALLKERNINVEAVLEHRLDVLIDEAFRLVEENREGGDK